MNSKDAEELGRAMRESDDAMRNRRGSAQAYKKLQTPDAILGIGSMIATMGLFVAKIAWDATTSAKLTVDQWTKYRAFCVWCLLSATATFAMLPFAWNEIRSS